LTLPPAVPNQPELTDADFVRAATALGVEVAAVKAVAAVEGSGRCFGADGRPIMRYELHTFNQATGAKYATTHPHLAAGYSAGLLAHPGGQAGEYSMLYGAMLLRGQRENAIASASWGAFQIMGFNHKSAGFATANDFAQSTYRSAGNQLDAFLSFARSKGASRYLLTKDWANFALHYNGTKYRDNNYDARLAAAYLRFGGTP
jgi:hypothetical protein